MQYENMHAKHVSGDVYELDNSPFYVFDISAGDVFSVNEVDGRILFNKIESRGGHSTYRVKMPFGAGHDKFEALWGELSEIGCSYEGSGKGDRLLYSIDVPPGVSVDKVYEILGKNEELNLWEFEEGHYFKSMQH
ncbi:MAG: DUF4265 domain-containing protein [Caulobacter sp.]|nr:DUF4265 domain-containing protein [Caulobacter sp.]